MKSPSGRYTDWSVVMRTAKKADGQFVLAVPDAPASMLYSVRERKARGLEQPDGYLQAELRNRHLDDDERVRGDLYVAFVRAKGGAK